VLQSDEAVSSDDGAHLADSWDMSKDVEDYKARKIRKRETKLLVPAGPRRDGKPDASGLVFDCE
jgi:hypothetical protein